MSIARRLFAAQFTYIGTIFAFVQPELFEKQLRQAYLGPPAAQDRDACLSYCQVLLILGFGQLYDVNTWISVEGPPGFEYFTHALHFLPDMHEEGSVLFVGVLALVGYFLQNLRRMDAAFLYMGNALRMAISLALHQEVSTQGLDENMKEYRRRTWWSVYSLDRILCVKSGNPVSIQDEDIGVALPSRLPHEEPYCAAVVLRHYTELSRILGQIMQKIYRRTPKSGSRLMAAVQEIMAALVHWRANIPAELYFDPAKLHTTRESVSTFLHYYQCINMTARPLLFHVVQKRLQGTEADRMQDWKQGLSLATVKIIETCVDGARDTITMMSIAAQQGLCATFGYMDGEHAFSAAIVLVMVCFAFPCTAADVTAMNVALDLLGSMAERGNQAIAARHKLLVNLRSLITPPQTLNEPSEISTDNLPADPILVATPGLLLDDSALEEMLADDSDIHFWEEGYTNPDLDMDYDLTQWTQAVQNNYGNIAM
ncbi:fungal-specific transcription factor domain-containing protein [Delphinella strobiligena]|nr:fungal-specific transcription factor domain-containing protein [Delphinella strobiligena]